MGLGIGVVAVFVPPKPRRPENRQPTPAGTSMSATTAPESYCTRTTLPGTDGVERVELEQPRQALQDAGATTELLSLHEGEIKARENDLDEAGTFPVDALVKSASADDYDALLLPGGTRREPDHQPLARGSPGLLRRDGRAVQPGQVRKP